MFGAWQVGVWQVLRERVQPDMIVGASAGSLNGWAVAGGATVEELTREWLDPLSTGRIMRLSPHPTGLMKPEGLYATARKFFAEYRPKVPFGLTLVEVPRLRPCLARDDEITWEHLAASCSIPFVFPPVRIGGKRYVDGGLLGAVPLWAAEKMGATRVVAANCLTSMPFRVMRRVVRPRQPSAKLEVQLIEPEHPLGLLQDAIIWKKANVERWIEQGARDANRVLSSGRM
jgi:NTE family protein